jgi:2-(1,2-epoxy-1,2-dihydrophenyl)acetyl-CoA isomerase
MGVVEYNKQDQLAIITLNRPEAMNAINVELGEALLKILVDVEYDENIRAILLTGTGKAFSSGGDVKAMIASPDPKSKFFKELTVFLNGIVNTIRMLKKPVVAGLNGAAAGAGVSLALACDLIVASRSAVFNLAYTKIGLPPDGGATALLTQHVGPKRAMEYIFFNPVINMQQALEIGLINRVFEDSTFLKEAIGFTKSVATGPTVAYGFTKRNINQAFSASFEQILELEREGIATCANTDDFIEAGRSFIEKRKSVFKGK